MVRPGARQFSLVPEVVHAVIGGAGFAWLTPSRSLLMLFTLWAVAVGIRSCHVQTNCSCPKKE